MLDKKVNNIGQQSETSALIALFTNFRANGLFPESPSIMHFFSPSDGLALNIISNAIAIAILNIVKALTALDDAAYNRAMLTFDNGVLDWIKTVDALIQKYQDNDDIQSKLSQFKWNIVGAWAGVAYYLSTAYPNMKTSQQLTAQMAKASSDIVDAQNIQTALQVDINKQIKIIGDPKSTASQRDAANQQFQFDQTSLEAAQQKEIDASKLRDLSESELTPLIVSIQKDGMTCQVSFTSPLDALIYSLVTEDEGPKNDIQCDSFRD